MSAFNRLKMPEQETCPNCGSLIVRAVQFAYGDVWQRDYELGDTVEWDGNNIGEAGHREVLVSGHPEGCPVCGFIPAVRYEITLRRDRIADLTVADLETEYQRFGHDGYLVTKD